MENYEDNATENRFLRPHLHHSVRGGQRGRYLVGAGTDYPLGTGLTGRNLKLTHYRRSNEIGTLSQSF